ncbi:plastid division protein PDV2-like [Andrographis paniculata]|uniref:plastid division protein PDV2-like n=1 Tax=Andrographis paniculata TaxID=175694 RepID=UPI0021E88330|nr:plastid division protein PDV2-like [Andrographis paniculata]
MDEDRIGLVLAKTSELRSKIVSCIRSKDFEYDDDDNNDNGVADQADNLLRIRDALESLELQLSSLQALQQQQWYEKESALAEIEFSQRKLLKVLKEYKGKDLEVIHEAIAFASVTEDNNDLLLPPYPTRPSQPIIADTGYLSTFISARKDPQKGTPPSARKDPESIPNNIHLSDSDPRQSRSSGPLKPVKFLIGTATRTALTILGVITILNLSGFEPSLRKRSDQFKFLDLFQLQWLNNVRRNQNDGKCPPGKVPVTENGEMRCVVKERIEIPFESVVAAPNVSYGFG